METGARETVLDYYEALGRGEPLYPYFVEHPNVVKFGISERLAGYEEVAEGLRDQTRTTTDWRVESRDLRIVPGGDCAAFADDVSMAWRSVESGREHDYDTRWSGTLVRREGADEEGTAEWLFAGLHVSGPVPLDGGE